MRVCVCVRVRLKCVSADPAAVSAAATFVTVNRWIRYQSHRSHPIDREFSSSVVSANSSLCVLDREVSTNLPAKEQKKSYCKKIIFIQNKYAKFSHFLLFYTYIILNSAGLSYSPFHHFRAKIITIPEITEPNNIVLGFAIFYDSNGWNDFDA